MKLAKTHDDCKSNKPQLTVVMIHGIASDSNTYNEALEYLEGIDELRNVRFVTFDLLGAGQSPKDDTLDYNYDDQLGALGESIRALEVNTPLVLVGHSLGTLITARYASKHPDKVDQLILIAPPIYTDEDLTRPEFKIGMEAFKNLIGMKNPQILKEKAFVNSMNNIVLDKNNYRVLTKLTVPTVLIYGDDDQLIASHNIPGVLEMNQKIQSVKTQGKHGVSRDKYVELEKLLKTYLKDAIHNKKGNVL